MAERAGDTPTEVDTSRQLELFERALAASCASRGAARTRRRPDPLARRPRALDARRGRADHPGGREGQVHRSTPLGQLVGRYLRWFRNEYGATPSTICDYEAVLARMNLTLADKEPIDVSVDDLRDVIDLWGVRSPRTRQKVTSVVRAF